MRREVAALDPRATAASQASPVAFPRVRPIPHNIYQENKIAPIKKAKVFMTGQGQAVRIPAEFRFGVNEVYIRRDPRNGDLILSETPGSWDKIFEALDRAGVPADFLADR